jgi:hypothetical protein
MQEDTMLHEDEVMNMEEVDDEVSSDEEEEEEGDEM